MNEQEYAMLQTAIAEHEKTGMRGPFAICVDIPQQDLVANGFGTYELIPSSRATSIIRYVLETYRGSIACQTMQRKLADSFDAHGKRTAKNFDLTVMFVPSIMAAPMFVRSIMTR